MRELLTFAINTSYIHKSSCRISKAHLLILLLSISALSNFQICAQPYRSVYLGDERLYSIWDIHATGWGDIDRDHDFDVVVTGHTTSIHTLVGRMLLNVGTDTFQVKNSESLFLYQGNTYDAISSGTIVFEDFDKDNIPEIFIAGTYYYDMWDPNTPHSIAKIWKMTETGGTLIWSRDISGDYTTFAGCADFDRDGDMDFHLNGAIYENKGGGQFLRNYKLKSDYPLIKWTDDVTNLDIADMNGDGVPDSLGLDYFYVNLADISTLHPPSIPIPDHVEIIQEQNSVKFYINPSSDTGSPPGKISYNLRVGTSPGGMEIVSPVADIATGKRYTSSPGNAGFNSWPIELKNLQPGVKYYWSVQAIDEKNLTSAFSPEQSFIFSRFQSHAPVLGTLIQGICLPGDFNNDNSFEILTASSRRKYEWGSASPIVDITGICNLQYFNDYGITTSAGLSDINNDGLLDIIISNQGSTPLIYKNNGTGTFPLMSLPLTAFNDANLSAADFDNDGDYDILVTGATSHGNLTYLLENKGNYIFVVKDSLQIEGVTLGSSAWGDYDNDLDQDVFISGITQNGSPVSRLFRNDNSTFILTSNNFVPLYAGSSEWGDYNNDNKLDLLLTGNTANGNPVTKIYKNLGSSFEELITGIIDVGKTYYNDSGRETSTKSQGKWCDFNNDGNLDIALYGNDQNGNQVSEIFWNKGQGQFEAFSSGFINTQSGNIIVADFFQNDGALDLVFSGTNTSAYQNSSLTINQPPKSPINLSYSLDGFDVLLHWDSGANNVSEPSGLTYNLRIGTVPGGIDIISPLADINTGKRRVASQGFTGTNTSWRIKKLPLGEYYWSVQAIDQSFNGGAWAPEQTFTITSVSSNFSADTICEGSPTRFTDLSLTSGGDVDGWKWYFGDGDSSSVKNPIHIYPDGGVYNVTLKAFYGSFQHSISKQVIVKHKPVAGFTAQTVCEGVKTSFINSSNLDNITNPIWKWSFGDGDVSSAAGSIDHAYLAASSYFAKLIIIADNGCSDTSMKSVLVAKYPVAVITSNAPLSFCNGDSITLSVSYNPDYLYTWKVDGSILTGGDSTRFTASVTGAYTVDVVNPAGNCKTTSAPVAVNARNAPVPPLITTLRPLEFCQGDSAILSVTNISGYTYQWKLNGGAIGLNKSTLTAFVSGNYSLIVENSYGCAATSSNTVTVAVNSNPTVPTVSTNGPIEFCQGSSVNLSVLNNPSNTFQWTKDGIAISEANTSSHTTSVSGSYSLIITSNKGCSNQTLPVFVNVAPSPPSPLINTSGVTTFCMGDSVDLSVNNTAGNTYLWKLNGGSVGSNSNKLTARNEGLYNLVILTSNGCSASSSNSVNVKVNALPVLPSVSLNGSNPFCSGGSVTLSTPLTSGYLYNWRNETGLISGANTNSLLVNATGNYQLDISNSSGCIVKTPPVNVVVKPMPFKPLIVSDNYQAGKCLGENPIRLSVSQAVSGAGYQWYKNGLPVSNETASYIEGFLPQGNYTIETDLSGCKAQSDPLNVFFDNAPEKPLIYAEGSNIWYLACCNDSASQYKWYYNGNLIQGADKYIYVANKNLGQYNVSIANTKGCFTISDAITIPTGTTGIEDIDPFAGLKIYPNPTPGLFTIEMDNQLFGDLHINILTQEGKSILKIKFEKTTVHYSSQIDLSGQSKGMYLINLLIDKYLANRKIMVE